MREIQPLSGGRMEKHTMNTTALIMAGGRGERFWPRSRKNLPKQFLSLTDDGKTMIQLTVERILPLVKMEDIYIATNKNYRELVRSQLPGIPEENILCEPVGRNTAPCIGLGAAHIGKKYENALMLVLPSDHLIKFNNMFLSSLREACRVAMEDDNLVTLGITPTYPETGYGYIKFNPQKTLGGAYQVERFVEKPTLEVAKEYLETEEYLWNSGMFIWKLSSIWKNMCRRLMPACRESERPSGRRRRKRCWSRNLRLCRRFPLTTALWRRHSTFIPFQEPSAGMTWVPGWRWSGSKRPTRTAT